MGKFDIFDSKEITPSTDRDWDSHWNRIYTDFREDTLNTKIIENETTKAFKLMRDLIRKIIITFINMKKGIYEIYINNHLLTIAPFDGAIIDMQELNKIIGRAPKDINIDKDHIKYIKHLYTPKHHKYIKYFRHNDYRYSNLDDKFCIRDYINMSHNVKNKKERKSNESTSDSSETKQKKKLTAITVLNKKMRSNRNYDANVMRYILKFAGHSVPNKHVVRRSSRERSSRERSSREKQIPDSLFDKISSYFNWARGK